MGDTLYVGSCSGKFLALDRGTGEVTWSYDTSVDGSGAQFHGDALVIDDVIVVGSDSLDRAYLYALDRGTGAVRWKREFTGGVPVTPLRHGRSVYVMTGAGDVVAVQLDGGEIGWTLSGPARTEVGRIRSDPVRAGERVLAAWPSGRVAAIDRTTGEPAWTADLGAAINTSLAVAGKAVVAGTIDGRLHRMDASSGEIEASLYLEGIPYGDLVVTDNCIYVFAGELKSESSTKARHELNCVEPSLEESTWTQQVSEEWSTFHPLLHGDVIVAGYTNRLVAYDRRTGTNRWACSIGETPRGLTSVGDRLYIGTLRGRVLAVSIVDCAHKES